MHVSAYITFVLAGVCGGISFLNEQSAWMIVVCSVLLIYSILNSGSWKDMCVGAYTAGILKTFIATSWVLTTYPFDWLTDISHSLQLILLFLTWLGAATAIGLGTALAACVVYALRRKRTLLHLSIVLFFILADIVGAYCFSLYMLGPNHAPNIHFGFSMYGYPLAEHGLLLPFATFGGVFALSLLLGAYTSGIYFFARHTKMQTLCFVTLCTLVFIATSFIPTAYFFSSVTVPSLAGIQTHYPAQKNISFEETKIRQRYLMEAIRKAEEFDPEIILLPESAGLTAYKYEYQVLNDLHRLNISSTVIDTTNTPIGRGTIQRSYIYDTKSNNVYTTEKQYSAPIGEYLPYMHHAVSTLLGIHAIQNIATQERGSIEIPLVAGDQIPTVLFCSESASPLLAYTRHSKRKPTLMVHPVSHSWFQSPYAYWNQERYMLKVQSVFLKTPILQTGNESPTLLFMPNGEVRSGKVTDLHAFIRVVTF